MTAPLVGKLRTWNDERGFGFIAPSNGSPELFVHVSAFPRDGSRPTEGETLSYELGRGKDGRPQAVRVVRQALGPVASYPARTRNTSRRSSVGAGLLVVVAVAGLGVYGYQHFRQVSQRAAIEQRQDTAPPQQATRPLMASPTANAFQCDGRTHCSQMSSCDEAKFFLQHCPGAQMDGDGDGIPCEQQWCSAK